MNKYRVIIAKLVLILSLIALTTAVNAQAGITEYRVYLATANTNGKDVVILRRFMQNETLSYLAVDVNSLETLIIPAKTTKATPATWQQISSTYGNKPYMAALQRAQKQSFALQDAGIIHGYPAEKGITLTIDLCPSHKPLDRKIFLSLINEFQQTEKPVPVALSISGRFLLTHIADIDWLKQLEAKGSIKVTWVNHTYTHHYDPRVPLAENFLLAPGTNINFEITANEMAMLQHGLVPSIFFRFPGLVSDNSVVDKVTGYGLIPIGSDAWLAKGQPAKPGSLVLIHGNGNEPIGVNDFIKLLHNNASLVKNHQWLLYDLRETVDDEFKQ